MLHKSASFHIVQIYLLLSNARKKKTDTENYYYKYKCSTSTTKIIAKHLNYFIIIILY